MRRIERLERRVENLEYGPRFSSIGKFSYYSRPRLSDDKKQQLIDDLHQFATDALKNREPQSLAVLPDILKYLLNTETKT